MKSSQGQRAQYLILQTALDRAGKDIVAGLKEINDRKIMNCANIQSCLKSFKMQKCVKGFTEEV